MSSLLWLLIFPIIWPFIAYKTFGISIKPPELVANILIVVLAVTTVFFAGRFLDLRDTEIWNGEVISKHRENGHYLRSYSCNCYTSCSGSGDTRTCTEHCSTCYEDRYTVEWYAKTTVGSIRFQYYDRSSKRVYQEPDPARFTKCLPGEPASVERSYKNYVKGAANSLFHTDLKDERVPSYPRVYDYYRLNRVIPTGEVSVDTKELNGLLNEGLKTLGKTKQVNVIVILTTFDATFKQAVENSWLGGKKNDVIVLLGMDGNRLVWHDVLTWARSTGNELFSVKLKDSLALVDTYQPKELSATILSEINLSYVRPKMSDFEYLKDSIEPPPWVTWLTIILAFIGSIALSIFFYYYDPFD